MAISIRCKNPDCGKVCRVKDEYAGKSVKCPGCGERITVLSQEPALSVGEPANEPAPREVRSAPRLKEPERPASRAVWPWLVGMAAMLLIGAGGGYLLTSSLAKKGEDHPAQTDPRSQELAAANADLTKRLAAAEEKLRSAAPDGKLKPKPEPAKPGPQSSTSPEAPGDGGNKPGNPLLVERILKNRMTHNEEVWSVAFSPDGKTLASMSTRDNTIKLWEVATGKEQATFKGHAMAFSPDGKTLLTPAGEAIKLWDVATGKERATFQGDSTKNGLSSVAFSPDGKTVASGSTGRRIGLWDVTTGKERITPEVFGMVRSLTFSPDGQTLASAGESWIRLWDVPTGKERSKLQGHLDFVSCVVFSRDGTMLASASPDDKTAERGGTIKLWDAATGKEQATLQGHKRRVWCVAFSPDGKTLASGDYVGTVKLWDVATGKEQTSLLAHPREVYSVAFSPDGKVLASGSGDGTIKLWEMSPAK